MKTNRKFRKKEEERQQRKEDGNKQRKLDLLSDQKMEDRRKEKNRFFVGKENKKRLTNEGHGTEQKRFLV